jgi:hypothetical protein
MSDGFTQSEKDSFMFSDEIKVSTISSWVTIKASTDIIFIADLK